MKENEEEVFPPTFDFSIPGGKPGQKRQLFGDILTLLDELDLKNENSDEVTPGSNTASIDTINTTSALSDSPEKANGHLRQPSAPQDAALDGHDRV